MAAILFEQVLATLRAKPRRWLITGVGGFIGSSLLEALLNAGQGVVGLDNFTTGKRENCLPRRNHSGGGAGQFELIEGDIRSLEVCRRACRGVEFILHQAAQVSVPNSILDPKGTHEVNVVGFVNLLQAARAENVQRVIYASSCAVYGDSPQLPLKEDQPAQPLSPYAASKLANEQDAADFARTESLATVGLRYFNVFGPRQDPAGVYAAVIPAWASAMIRNEPIRIYGDGSTTRDFCFIANAVQANLLAATFPVSPCGHEVVNVATGGRTSLNELFELLRRGLLPHYPHLKSYRPAYEDFRPGDIRHSQADITKAKELLGYAPSHTVEQGLHEALAWYRNLPAVKP